MIPTDFPEANMRLGEPLSPIYEGAMNGGPQDGYPILVMAWQPDAEELEDIKSGKPIFITFFKLMPPHTLQTSFKAATFS